MANVESDIALASGGRGKPALLTMAGPSQCEWCNWNIQRFTEVVTKLFTQIKPALK